MSNLLSDIQLYDNNIILIAVIFAGLSFGSFATAVAYRVPLGKQFITGRSKCPNCSHALGFFDLFPILSWILLRGKCRYCSKTFGFSYIAIEISTALMFFAVYTSKGISVEAIILFALSVCIIILVAIDFEHYIIPDGLTLTMLIIGILYQINLDAPLHYFITGPLTGLFIGFSLRWTMWIWKKKEGLGMGDVKFLAVVGIFLDIESIITFLFLSGVIGIVTAMLWKVLGRGERFPFGPSLCLSLFVCVLWTDFEVWWRGCIEVFVGMFITSS